VISPALHAQLRFPAASLISGEPGGPADASAVWHTGDSCSGVERVEFESPIYPAKLCTSHRADKVKI
jgi:hypothetical protein